MTHASRELLWMMLGYALNDPWTFSYAIRDTGERECACGSISDTRAWGWWQGAGAVTAPAPPRILREHVEAVTCPRCLVAMDAAREGRDLTGRIG